MNANFLRSILTAAHCICMSRGRRSKAREKGNDLESFTACRRPLIFTSRPTQRFNQHIPLKDSAGLLLESQEIEFMWNKKKTTKMNSFNHIDVKIGSRDFTTGVLQRVKSAYVMYVESEIISEKPDIALIVVEREIDRNGMYPDMPVVPICLPSR